MSDTSSQMSHLNANRQAAFAEGLKETLEASQTAANEIAESRQDASEDTLKSEAEGNFTAAGIAKRTTKLEPRKDVKKSEKKEVQESVLVRKEDADSLADEFSQRQGNREYRLDTRSLSQIVAEELGFGINESTDADTIITLIRNRMTIDGELPDVAIVDKAFEFLLEASRIKVNQITGSEKERLIKTISRIEIAKNKHFELNAIEIQVAQKIIGAVDAVVETTGQSVKETLNRYREVVHNPPDLQALRKFYENKGYKSMVLELKGLSTYLGGNLKRSNLENPEIAQLAAAARKMQALLGVFRQSKLHFRTMENYLTLNGILTAA